VYVHVHVYVYVHIYVHIYMYVYVYAYQSKDGEFFCPMNMYRAGGDIHASFGSILGEIYSTITWNDRKYPYSRPGGWVGGRVCAHTHKHPYIYSGYPYTHIFITPCTPTRYTHILFRIHIYTHILIHRWNDRKYTYSTPDG